MPGELGCSWHSLADIESALSPPSTRGLTRLEILMKVEPQRALEPIVVSERHSGHLRSARRDYRNIFE